LTGHRTRSDERDQANAYEQFHFSDRLSELGFEGLRRSIRDNSFAPFTELHPGPLQPVKLPPDATSAFSALAAGEFRFRQTPFYPYLVFRTERQVIIPVLLFPPAVIKLKGMSLKRKEG